MPSHAELAEFIGFCLGEQIPLDSVEMAGEELGLSDRDAPWSELIERGAGELTVLIIGAGWAGICMAAKLQRAGVRHVVIERNADIGGTWLDTTYPGCGVDTPSHLYQFTFDPSPDWPGHYSKRDDVLAYLHGCVERHGIAKNIRLNTTVTGARWEEDDHSWSVDITAPGELKESLSADILVTATGLFGAPKYPDIPGADSFEGVAVHTADWDPGLRLDGKRVAVIGSGASAMQVVPAIAGRARHVTVFQRSPLWATPNPDLHRPVSAAAQHLMRTIPIYAGAYRFRQFWMWNDHIWPGLQKDPAWPHPDRAVNAANDRYRAFLTRHIDAELDGAPELREKCLPSYPPYGKRMLMDAGWFKTLRRTDVSLVTEPIAGLSATGVTTADDEQHPVDVVVYATGYDAHRPLWPIDIRGRENTTIRDVWGDDDPRAYLGICVPRFPNMFCLYGPNTSLGHGGSIIFQIELQVRYVMGMLTAMASHDVSSVEVRTEAHDNYNHELDQAHERMIWTHPGMSTWYRNARGRVTVLSPWRLVDYWRMTRSPDLNNFKINRLGDAGRRGVEPPARQDICP